MSQSNTLFILANWGLKVNKDNKLESHMWLLNNQEVAMDFVSFHKSKSERAYKGGRIIDIRSATPKEIAEHQALMIKNNKGVMKDIENRKIIVFYPESKWNVLWPEDAKTSQMAYKGTGFIKWP